LLGIPIPMTGPASTGENPKFRPELRQPQSPNGPLISIATAFVAA
jgi:hypothetical protein